MSVWDMWSLCDRCGFKYRRKQLKRESTGFIVCRRCDDGAYDLRRHPQNRPAPVRRELLPVPDGRSDVDLTQYLAQEINRALLLTENGERILITNAVWAPNKSVYTRTR